MARTPGGVTSPVRAWRAVGGEPIFIQRARGSAIWDVDGNSYVDYIGSWGPSNTSSLPAARIFSGLRHKRRATVTHFFAPAWRNPVVEVVRAKDADVATIDYLRWLFCVTGKVPLVTADVECFMLDRIFDNWCNDAALCLSRATAREIDSVASEFVQAGPFFVLNLANGNPIIVETNTLQAAAEGEHYRAAPIFRSVARWTTGAIGEQVAVAPGVAAAVRDRLLGVLWSQAADIVYRDIGDAADLDLGCRLALVFKQGPLDLMRTQGAPEVERVMRRFAAERPGMPLPMPPWWRCWRRSESTRSATRYEGSGTAPSWETSVSRVGVGLRRLN